MGGLTGRAQQGRPPVSGQFPHIRTPWKAVAAELRDAIERGATAPGDPVPSLTALTARYGVSSSTAHKALRRLAAEGLIEPVPGRPYRVVVPSPQAGRG